MTQIIFFYILLIEVAYVTTEHCINVHIINTSLEINTLFKICMLS